MSTEDVFWSRVNKDGPTQAHMTTRCWVWTGTSAGGYGRFDKMRAHRIAFMLANGLIPPGLLVRHKCDHPPCVNPDHLLLGTDMDNVRDAQQRGRRPTRAPGGKYDVVYTFRIPADIVNRVNALAERDGVTRSAKIVAYLREGVARDEREPKESRPYGEGTALAHIVGTVVVVGPCDVESPWQMSETLAAEIESARMGV